MIPAQGRQRAWLRFGTARVSRKNPARHAPFFAREPPHVFRRREAKFQNEKRQIMKLKKISALFLAAASVAGVSYAGTFGFEDVASSSIPQNSAALQNNAYTGGDYGTFKTSSQGVTASLEYAFSYDSDTYTGYWGGGIVSNQKGNSATRTTCSQNPAARRPETISASFMFRLWI